MNSDTTFSIRNKFMFIALDIKALPVFLSLAVLFKIFGALFFSFVFALAVCRKAQPHTVTKPSEINGNSQFSMLDRENLFSMLIHWVWFSALISSIFFIHFHRYELENIEVIRFLSDIYYSSHNSKQDNFIGELISTPDRWIAILFSTINIFIYWLFIIALYLFRKKILKGYTNILSVCIDNNKVDTKSLVLAFNAVLILGLIVIGWELYFRDYNLHSPESVPVAIAYIKNQYLGPLLYYAILPLMVLGISFPAFFLIFLHLSVTKAKGIPVESR